jgi:hypothetical protein
MPNQKLPYKTKPTPDNNAKPNQTIQRRIKPNQTKQCRINSNQQKTKQNKTKSAE